MLNFHDPGCLTTKEFYYEYEMPLARAFYEINKRGIRVDLGRLEGLRQFINRDLQKSCLAVTKSIGGRRVVSSAPLDSRGKKQKLEADVLNLSSPQQIIDCLKSLGLKPPMKRRDNFSYTETSDEEALNEMYAETGHPVLKEILRVRELNKVLGTNVNAELDQGILYSSFFVTGTVTGRRSSRENFLGLGTNLQNQPTHSDLGKKYHECLVSRPGRIFVACDQVSAEDWIIQGTIADACGSQAGLEDLARGGRHEKLACFIFGKPLEQIRYDVERYLAKKVRYAGSYDMRAPRFASEMAKEGYVMPEQQCEWLLEQFHKAEPTIKGVFHEYVQTELKAKRQLTTPFGRVRQFLGLRDYSDNSKLFKEAYAQIPQSTVGDNTGMSILWLETNYPGHVVSDGHDSVGMEVPDRAEDVVVSVGKLRESFKRIIRFPITRLEITIPIEVKIGYDLEHMHKCEAFSEDGLMSTYNSLVKQASPPPTSTSGQLQPSSAPL